MIFVDFLPRGRIKVGVTGHIIVQQVDSLRNAALTPPKSPLEGTKQNWAPKNDYKIDSIPQYIRSVSIPSYLKPPSNH